MKPLLTVFAALALSTFASAKEGWLDNMETAKAQAKKENKKILVDFNGSDWCSMCKKLDKEVFNTPEFKDYAAKNLVLLELDFPLTFKLPEPLKKQNDLLAQQYKIDAYPTIMVMTSAGVEAGKMAYVEGGAPAFIDALEHVKK